MVTGRMMIAARNYQFSLPPARRIDNKTPGGASNAFVAAGADAAKDVKDANGAGDAIDGILLAPWLGTLMGLTLNELAQGRDQNQFSADNRDGADQPLFDPTLNGAL